MSLLSLPVAMRPRVSAVADEGPAPASPRTWASRWLDTPRSPRTLALWLSLYLLVALNWPMWHALAQIGGGAPSAYLPLVLPMAVLLLCANTAVLTLAAWPRAAKPLWLAVVVAAALAQHFMLAYRVVMDPGMLANALQTDSGEVRALLGARMLWNVLVPTLPAAWLLWRVPVRRAGLLPDAWRNLALLAGLALVAAATIVAGNRTLAPLMRNHVGLRYMMNPVASLYSTVKVVARPLVTQRRRLVPITAGTTLGAAYAGQARPPLLLLVVGETARADHFALNGYARDTTPGLAAHGVLSWRQATSCGTSTLASVPCMFSPLGRSGHLASRDDHENLMDVLQAAGLGVLWLDNQPGGCKGVCDRVPHASAFAGLDAATRAALCHGDECLDEVMLQGLDARIAALPAERRAKGVVLVMHQMGSHGPAYHQRSPAQKKRFLPECRTNVLADCSHAELVNAFDNSIAYTDDFLGRAIDWLAAREKDYDPGLIYMSDHGESLGEYGLFLHGVPYDFAPEAQKHVPLVMWFSDGLRRRDDVSAACLRGRLDQPVSHDNLFHTVLGVMGVKNPYYQARLDLVDACGGSPG